MAAMTACVLHRQAPIADRPLSIEEAPKPTPGPGQVLIRVHVCAVCRTDLHVVEGDLEPRKLPLTPGHQVVGTVEASGEADLQTGGAGQGSDAGGSPASSNQLSIGDRVGVAWLHDTCGHCRFCDSDRENLCESARFTGWSVDGGYAEWMVAPAAFVYPLPGELDDVQAAPLLCAGIIGYRCIRRLGIARSDFVGKRIGIYGFGAAGHIAIQILRHRGADVYVCTRDVERHQALARELGAVWIGGSHEVPPEKLDGSMIFAPAGDIIPPALAALDKGATLVLGGIHMSPTPPIDYPLLYDERIVRSVANNTRDDGRAFLKEAAEANVQTSTTVFPLREANEALYALQHDAFRGAAVLDCRA